MTGIFINTAVRTSNLAIRSCFCDYKNSSSYNLGISAHTRTHTHTHTIIAFLSVNEVEDWSSNFQTWHTKFCKL